MQPLLPGQTTPFHPQWGIVEREGRITSYNVCYTKLLRFTLTDGRIAFNVTGSELNGTGATIEFYNIDEIMYSSDFTADDIYEYLVAYSDNGTALDISELVTGYELDGTTFRFNVTHFTVYEIDYDDGLIHIKQEDFNNETGYIINESGYYVLDDRITSYNVCYTKLLRDS